jgi:hypothetical protein
MQDLWNTTKRPNGLSFIPMGTEEGEKVEAKGIENIFNEISRKLL